MHRHEQWAPSLCRCREDHIWFLVSAPRIPPKDARGVDPPCIAQTVVNINLYKVEKLWLRWDGNNSCWKASSRGFQEKPCDAAEPALLPLMWPIPLPGPRKCPCAHQHQPACCRPKPVGCETDWRGFSCGLCSHPNKQQAGKVIQQSPVISPFASSHRGKMLSRSLSISACERASLRRLISKQGVLVIHTVSLIEGSWTPFGNPGKVQGSLLGETLHFNCKEIQQLLQIKTPTELFHSLLYHPCLPPLDA